MPTLFILWMLGPVFAADPSGILSLFSHHGMARGCPIAATSLLTARHVGVQSHDGRTTSLGMIWSDAAGVTGTAWTVDYDLRRDLALMHSDRPFLRPYRIAAEPPIVGDKVVYAGYQFNDRFQMKVITARVLNIVAGHLVLSDGAEQGFSGSCVLNAQNEAVAIFVWSVENRSTRRGVASGIWGDLASIAWVPPVVEAQP